MLSIKETFYCNRPTGISNIKKKKKNHLKDAESAPNRRESPQNVRIGLIRSKNSVESAESTRFHRFSVKKTLGRETRVNLDSADFPNHVYKEG